ncbi:MAG: hypothetical protein QXH67_00780 [Candidatus Bathyarchaeia archaeon]
MTSKSIRQTEGPVQLHLFEKDPLSNVLGIFSNILVANHLRAILNKVVRRAMGKVVTPIIEVTFSLHEKEDEMRKIPEFTNVSEVKVEDARDLYIEELWLKGSYLEESEEYRKFITDPKTAGKMKFIALTYRDKVYYLNSDARLYTRQASDIKSDYRDIYEITRRLYDVGAVKFY